MNKKNNIILCIIIGCLLVVIGFGGYKIYDLNSKLEQNDSNKETNKEEAGNKPSEKLPVAEIIKKPANDERNGNYTVTLKEPKMGKKYEAQIADNINLKFLVEHLDTEDVEDVPGPGYFITARIFLNDKDCGTINQIDWQYKLDFILKDNNVVFMNKSGFGSSRYNVPTIVTVLNTDGDNFVIKEIDYDHYGMLSVDAELKNDSLIIMGSRDRTGSVGSPFEITYCEKGVKECDDIYLDVCDVDGIAKSGLSEDAIIKATYIYKYENGKFLKKPEVKNQMDVKAFIKDVKEISPYLCEK